MNLFKTVRALVIGDVMVDEFIDGTVDRLSPEAPVPVFKPAAINSTLGYCPTVLGGAGNVCANLKALGCARAEVIGVVGGDAGTYSCLADLPDLIRLDRKTTVKRRLTARGQHLLRIDWEDTKSLIADEAAALLQKAAPLLIEANVLVLADYAKGVVTRSVSEHLIKAAADLGIPVVVDTKKRRIAQFAGATCIAPNKLELEAIVNRPLLSSVALGAAMLELGKNFAIPNVVVTLGDKGLMYTCPEPEMPTELVYWADSEQQEVADVCGAGDTVTAVLAAGLGAGMDFGETARLANAAAGTVVRHRGVSVVDPAEMIEVDAVAEVPEPVGNGTKEVADGCLAG